MTREELRIKFNQETGITWINFQDEPDIDYVYWLENFIVNSLPNGEASSVSTNELTNKYAGCIFLSSSPPIFLYRHLYQPQLNFHSASD